MGHEIEYEDDNDRACEELTDGTTSIVLPSKVFANAEELMNVLKPPFFDEYFIEVVNPGDTAKCFSAASRGTLLSVAAAAVAGLHVDDDDTARSAPDAAAVLAAVKGVKYDTLHARVDDQSFAAIGEDGSWLGIIRGELELDEKKGLRYQLDRYRPFP